MAAERYKNSAGKIVPSVTTILKANLGWSNPGLQYWAWDLGMKGIDYRTERDTAASIGTAAHLMIEAFLIETEANLAEIPEELIEAAMVPYENFLNWYMEHDVQVIDTEKKLVSEKHQFGGKRDGTVLFNGRFMLLDFKTSKRVYEEMIAQIGGYSLLEAEQVGHPFEEACLLHLSKEGGFAPYYLNRMDIEMGEQLFLQLRGIHRAQPILKKIIEREMLRNGLDIAD